MKISRSQLKSLVKECLVEILQEGLSAAPIAASQRVATNERRDRSQEPLPGNQHRYVDAPGVDPATVRRRTLDLVEHRPTPSPVLHQAQQAKRVPDVLAEAFGGDPIMASIFADTASTTLAAQESPSASVQGDQAAKAAAAMDPLDLFGDDKIDKWNRAAFSATLPTVAAAIKRE